MEPQIRIDREEGQSCICWLVYFPQWPHWLGLAQHESTSPRLHLDFPCRWQGLSTWKTIFLPVFAGSLAGPGLEVEQLGLNLVLLYGMLSLQASISPGVPQLLPHFFQGGECFKPVLMEVEISSFFSILFFNKMKCWILPQDSPHNRHFYRQKDQQSLEELRMLFKQHRECKW